MKLVFVSETSVLLSWFKYKTETETDLLTDTGSIHQRDWVFNE